MLAFEADIIEWRGPPPYLFAPIPDHLVGEVHYAAREASYGWGMVPVTAQIGTTKFTTSLFRRGDTYVLPIKVAVPPDRRAELMTLAQVFRARAVDLGPDAVVFEVVGTPEELKAQASVRAPRHPRVLF